MMDATKDDSLGPFMAEAGINSAEVETMVRLAALVGTGETYRMALASFSDPHEVDAIAERVARNLYAQWENR